MTISACCGASVLLNYGANIFKDSGSTFDTNLSTIIMGSVQLFGTLCVISLIDNFGRKFLLIISSIGCAFGLAALGVYNYLSIHGNMSMENFNWIPVASVSIGLFSICIGVMPVSFVLMAEILPASVSNKYINYNGYCTKKFNYFKKLLFTDPIIRFNDLFDNI